jgi:predicted transglutaminase-like cysteine proteinase
MTVGVPAGSEGADMFRINHVALALALLMPSLAAAAAPRQTSAHPTFGVARPLPAWSALCERLPSECAVDQSEPERIALDAQTWSLLLRVNALVAKRVAPTEDMDHWGVPDRWDFAEDGKGDCEDYALLKRRLLAEAGLPRRAMRMTVVIDEAKVGHAVLTVLTDKGDLVLDNKDSRILPWARTGYEFVKRESTYATGWVALRPDVGVGGVPMAASGFAPGAEGPTGAR